MWNTTRVQMWGEHFLAVWTLDPRHFRRFFACDAKTKD